MLLDIEPLVMGSTVAIGRFLSARQSMSLGMIPSSDQDIHP